MVVDAWVGDTNIHPQSAGLGADSSAISKPVGWGDFGYVDAIVHSARIQTTVLPWL